MKRIGLFLLATCFAALTFAQSTEGDPANKLKPDLPAFKLLSLDSTKVQTKDALSKDMPTMIIIFSPDCDHCNMLAKELVIHQKKFEDIQIVMGSFFKGLKEIQSFYERNELSKLKHLAIGKDHSYFFASYYKASKFPFTALYNKDQQLIATYELNIDITQIAEIFNK